MADSKPVKQEVNGTVILPPLVFPGSRVCHWVQLGSYSRPEAVMGEIIKC
jgi:hypothetical protein